MATLNVIGKWLDGSGWALILNNANVTTEGRADNVIKGGNTSRSQWAHQISVAGLYHMMKDAYIAYKDHTVAQRVRLQ